MSQKQTPNYTFALIVVFIVCFLIGFVTTMNNSMIPFCSKAFNLTAQDGQYVNSAFYGAYLLAIPFSFLMSKIGYKGTLVLGLAVVGRFRNQFARHQRGHLSRSQCLCGVPRHHVSCSHGYRDASECGQPLCYGARFA